MKRSPKKSRVFRGELVTHRDHGEVYKSSVNCVFVGECASSYGPALYMGWTGKHKLGSGGYRGGVNGVKNCWDDTSTHSGRSTEGQLLYRTQL